MKLPPGPSTLSILQLMQWSNRPSDFLDACTQKYGNTFTSKWAGFAPSVFISTPEAIEQVFTAPAGQLESGQGNKIFQPFVGEYSLMLLDGPTHQRQRKLLLPPFHGERMKVYGELICKLTEKTMQSWEPGSSFSIRHVMEEIALEIILGAVFGVTKGERFNELKYYLNAMLALLGTPLGALSIFVPILQQNWGSRSPWGKFLQIKSQVDRLLYAEIADRQQKSNAGHTDILSLLMSARDEAGEPMSAVELHDELLTLLITGHETSATSLVWALYWIHHLPTVRDSAEPTLRERLLAEIKSLGDNPDPSDIVRLPYLTAVCQETLRIYPTIVVAFPRLVKSPFQLLGYELPIGTQIFPAIYAAHHRPELFSEPKEFRPERFLDRQYSAYEYLPFGGGSHRCIGSAFALFEMKLVLATMLTRYDFILSDALPVSPVRRNGGLAPDRDLRLIVKMH